MEDENKIDISETPLSAKFSFYTELDEEEISGVVEVYYDDDGYIRDLEIVEIDNEEVRDKILEMLEEEFNLR